MPEVLAVNPERYVPHQYYGTRNIKCGRSERQHRSGRVSEDCASNVTWGKPILARMSIIDQECLVMCPWPDPCRPA
jgi:hypothetical protein